MSHRLAYLVVAALAFVAVWQAIMSGRSLPDPVPSVEVVVDGVAVPRYAHGGRWYIEARKGREYAIRLRNPYPVRVVVALSVDGINTIDARETTAADARKWVLDPYETVTIRGWQTTKTEARRFEFTTEDGSYGQALGKTANLGIPAAVFFKERVRAVSPEMSNGQARSRSAPAPISRSADERTASARSARPARPAREEARAVAEYAATGMGRATDHAVTQVRLTVEDAPTHSVNIRYEFRPQLVALGVLPPTPATDPLHRRERALGFEPGFCPEPRQR